MRDGTRQYLGKRLLVGPGPDWTTQDIINWIMTGDADLTIGVLPSLPASPKDAAPEPDAAEPD